MSDHSSQPPKVSSSRRRTAVPARTAFEEIGEMTAELARFARRHDLSTLAYFLEMAHIEASDQARRLGGEPVGEIKRGRR